MEECLELRRTVEMHVEKISELEQVIGELLTTITEKESEIVSMLRKYEQNKTTDEALEAKKGMTNQHSSKINQILIKRADSAKPNQAATKEKFKSFVKEVTKTLVLVRSKDKVHESIPVEVVTIIRDQLAATFTNIISQDAEADVNFIKSLNIESIIEEQLKILISQDPPPTEEKPDASQETSNKLSVVVDTIKRPSIRPEKNTSQKGNDKKVTDTKIDDITNAFFERNRKAGKSNDPLDQENPPLGLKRLAKLNDNTSFSVKNPSSKNLDQADSRKELKDNNQGSAKKDNNTPVLPQRDQVNRSLLEDKTTIDGYLLELSDRLEAIKNVHFKSDLLEMVDAVIKLGSSTSRVTLEIGKGRMLVKMSGSTANPTQPHGISKPGNMLHPATRMNSGATIQSFNSDMAKQESHTVKPSSKQIKNDKPLTIKADKEVRDNRLAKVFVNVAVQTDEVKEDGNNPHDAHDARMLRRASEHGVFRELLEPAPSSSGVNRIKTNNIKFNVHSIELMMEEMLQNPKVVHFLDNLKHYKIFDKLYDLTQAGTSLQLLLNLDATKQSNSNENLGTSFYYQNLTNYSKFAGKNLKDDRTNFTMDHTRRTSVPADGITEDQDQFERQTGDRFARTKRDNSDPYKKLSYSQSHLRNFFKTGDLNLEINRKGLRDSNGGYFSLRDQGRLTNMSLEKKGRR
jgi:hypothetical protein